MGYKRILEIAETFEKLADTAHVNQFLREQNLTDEDIQGRGKPVSPWQKSEYDRLRLLETGADPKTKPVPKLTTEVPPGAITDKTRGEFPQTPAKPTTKPVSGANLTLKRVQEKLKGMGFYTANIDGIMGPETQRAIGKYLTANPSKVGGNVYQSILSTPPAKEIIKEVPF